MLAVRLKSKKAREKKEERKKQRKENRCKCMEQYDLYIELMLISFVIP